ncbi:hypothetical protein BDK51DRAFT_31620 [Blyttiomyces helicus]|uniref:Uncharacterized protein n=1 Tax=Blyttiomyces helicus TaxID=388810 RepID=A0A4P9WMJ7_9FUNG|nr:hypothetical protein BDK51DRAFT_31620 [Blyttiomyces helicus]|eukprot:RKO94301.1 hypothetical protein BDK51DRAFT_31620 [Blyttiomyces helicus]
MDGLPRGLALLALLLHINRDKVYHPSSESHLAKSSPLLSPLTLLCLLLQRRSVAPPQRIRLEPVAPFGKRTSKPLGNLTSGPATSDPIGRLEGSSNGTPSSASHSAALGSGSQDGPKRARAVCPCEVGEAIDEGARVVDKWAEVSTKLEERRMRQAARRWLQYPGTQLVNVLVGGGGADENCVYLKPLESTLDSGETRRGRIPGHDREVGTMQVKKALGSSILNSVGNLDHKTPFRGRLWSTRRRWAWISEPLQLEDSTLKGPAAEDCWNNDRDAVSDEGIDSDASAVECHWPKAVRFEEGVEAFGVIVCVGEKVAGTTGCLGCLNPRHG